MDESILNWASMVRCFALRGIRWRTHLRLSQRKAYQRARFDSLTYRFPRLYGALREGDVSRFTTPVWETLNSALAKQLLPYPQFSFLRSPTFMRTMFVTAGGAWLREQMSYLERSFSKQRLRAVLEEDYVGDPLLMVPEYATSHNSVHHLYHLATFMFKTGVDVRDAPRVIEWGGGYGSMARIFRRLTGVVQTYVIIDIPLLTCLQWLYLSTIFGEDQVNVLTTSRSEIAPGMFNLLPVCFLEDQTLSGDLFIATWSLSESSTYAQQYVFFRDFFCARHFLVAYQDSSETLPHAARLGELCVARGGVLEDLRLPRGSHYAFR